MNGWRKSSWSHVNGNCVEVGEGWRKSTRSEAGNCVETGNGPGGVLVRDTTDRDGPELAFTPGAWTEFAARITAGRRPS